MSRSRSRLLSRRRALALPVLVLLALTASLIYQRSPLDQAAFDRVELGMPLDEVESALGVPPGKYCGNAPPDSIDSQTARGHEILLPGNSVPVSAGPGAFDAVDRDSGRVTMRTRTWTDGAHVIGVAAVGGKVVKKVHATLIPAHKRWLRRLRRWLGV